MNRDQPHRDEGVSGRNHHAWAAISANDTLAQEVQCSRRLAASLTSGEGGTALAGRLIVALHWWTGDRNASMEDRFNVPGMGALECIAVPMLNTHRARTAVDAARRRCTRGSVRRKTAADRAVERYTRPARAPGF